VGIIIPYISYWWIALLIISGLFILDIQRSSSKVKTPMHLSPVKPEGFNKDRLIKWIFLLQIAVYSSIFYFAMGCGQGFFCFFGTLWGTILFMVAGILLAAFWPEKENQIKEKLAKLEPEIIKRKEL